LLHNSFSSGKFYIFYSVCIYFLNNFKGLNKKGDYGMKVKVWIKYEESYLPTRCRKLRYRECDEHVALTLPEAAMDNLRLAFEDFSYDIPRKIYFYKGKFWRLASVRDISCSDKAENHTPLENLIYVKDHSSFFFCRPSMRETDSLGTSRASMIKLARSDLRKYLLVGNDLYIQTSEPRYCIYTFGLGHNHGGTSLSVDYHYNSNISKNRYFSALQGDEAVTEAIRIATNRGDTESLKRITARIKVYAPDLVKINPQRQHGNGNRFLNLMDSITESASDTMTAGLLCIAQTCSFNKSL